MSDLSINTDALLQTTQDYGEEILSWFLPNLSTIEWTGHIAILVWSFLMIMFSKRLFAMVENTSSTVLKMKVFRTFNFFVVVLLLLDLAMLRFHLDYEQILARVALSLFATYSAIYLYTLVSYHSFKRFGSPKMIDNKEVFVETYSTRIINLLLVIIFCFGTLYTIIQVWGADSLLQTTGIMGIFVGFLAFTSAVWAPDIISGLIILNSQILDDGDVVVVDGFPNEYIISKVSFVYVTLYDIRNNHRTLIKNSRFLQSKIDNLSRIASTDGLRQFIKYNIGYPKLQGTNSSERIAAYETFMSKVDSMFKRACDDCFQSAETQLNTNKPFEWALTKTGDYALEFTLWFCYKRLPNTKITATARKHLMGSLFQVNKAVYKASIFEGLDLSTPDLATLQLSSSEPDTYYDGSKLANGNPHKHEAAPPSAKRLPG
jgi:Mechanosensitive ion channel, beta-domain